MPERQSVPAESSQAPLLQPPTRTILGLVFLIVFIDLMGFGIVIPLLPLYAEHYQPTPAAFGFLMAAFSLFQFLCSPVLGRLSDRIGRRPVLVVSLLGTVIGYLLFAFQRSYTVLLLSRIIDGAFGGNIATAQAVIADVTEKRDRARGMGMVGAAFGLGFVVGPAIGGFAVRLNPAAPGLAAALLSLVALVLTWMRLPETRPVTVTGAGAATGRWPLAEAWRVPDLRTVLALTFLATFAFASFENTLSLFAHHRLSLEPHQVAFLFVYAGVLAAFVQGGLVGRVVRRIGERKVVIAGAVILTPCFIILPMVGSVAALLWLLPGLALGMGLIYPSLSSLASHTATDATQGLVLGANQSMSALARIVGPFTAVYVFTRFDPRWPYVIAAAASLVVLALALLLHSESAD